MKDLYFIKNHVRILRIHYNDVRLLPHIVMLVPLSSSPNLSKPKEDAKVWRWRCSFAPCTRSRSFTFTHTHARSLLNSSAYADAFASDVVEDVDVAELVAAHFVKSSSETMPSLSESSTAINLRASALDARKKL